MKKNFKLALALILVALMMLMVSVGALAEDVTIKIGSQETGYATTDPNAATLSNHDFNAYQILAAEGYDTSTQKYTNITWGTAMTGKQSALLTALKASTNSTINAAFANFDMALTEGKTQFTAASFANAISGYAHNSTEAKAIAQILKGIVVADGVTKTPVKAGTATTLSGTGYYLIDDVTTLASGDVANPVVLFATPGENEIKIKTEKPSQEKKVQENVKTGNWEDDEKYGDRFNDVADYNVGDYVPYEILSKVPNMDDYTAYDMTFTDIMSDGLTYFRTDATDAKNLVVTVGSTTLEKGTDYTVTDVSDRGFKVNIVLKENGALKKAIYTTGAAIKLAFYGQLNDSAVIGSTGNTNTSTLTYSNNPDNTSSHTTTPGDTVIVFTYELDVTKIDGTSAGAAEQIKLPGAQFALYRVNGTTNEYAVLSDSGKVASWRTTAPVADATTDKALLVSDKNGLFKIAGLDDGTYYLQEIKAPTGYNLLADPIKVNIVATTANGQNNGTSTDLTALKINIDDEKIGGEGDDKNDPKYTDGNTSTGVVTTTVINNSGAQLPSTGGIGTTIFYVAGSILVLAAAILLITKRRMGAND